MWPAVLVNICYQNYHLSVCFRFFFTSFPKFSIRKYTDFPTHNHGCDSTEFCSTLYFACDCAFSLLLYYSEYLVVVFSFNGLKTVRIETIPLLFIIDFISSIWFNASYIAFNKYVPVKQMNKLLLRSSG